MTVREERGTAAGRRWPPVVGAAVVVVLGVVLALAPGWLPRPGGPSPDAPAPDAPAAAAPRLDAGWAHTCWVEEDGSLACWGANTGAELGLGIRTPARVEPVRVLGPEPRIVSVSAGGGRSCALTDAGAVWCWGQVTPGDTSPTFPVAVAGLGPGVRSVSAGGSHTCAVAGDGSVWCWGDNQSGQLGGDPPRYDSGGVLLSGVERSAVPLRVPGLDPVVSVAAGGTHTCALTTRGGVACWGDNYWGQLGQGAPPTYDDEGTLVSGTLSNPVPRPVTGLDTGAVALSTGTTHTCALTGSRGVVCWGSNTEGQLGQGSVPTYDPETGRLLTGPESSGSPLPVAGVEGVVSLSAGGGHTCVVSAGADVRCWGSNSSGQLGQPPPTLDDEGDVVSGVAASAVPVAVTGAGPEVAWVAAGWQHTCAATPRGDVSCWGDNSSSQLGDVAVTTAGAGARFRVRPTPGALVTPRTKVLNLIVVESTVGAGAEGSVDQRSTRTTAAALYARDPQLLESMRVGVLAATAGRLEPQVEVTVADGLLDRFKGCVDSDRGDLIEDVARPHFRDGAMNVVVLRAGLCPDDQWGAIGGYDGWAQAPVVGWTSLASVTEFLHVILHEYGHDASLPHAGLATCTGAAALTGCRTDEVGDPASVMSYVGVSDAFTAPELARMGLLSDAELVDATGASGEFHLVDLWEEGTKVLRLRDVVAAPETTLVDFSRGSAPVEVRFEKGYAGASVYEPGKNQTSLAVVSTGQPPLPGDVILRQKGVTVTYEGPDADGNSVIKVTRTP